MSRAIVTRNPVSLNDIAVQVKKAVQAISRASVAVAREIKRRKEEFDAMLTPEGKAIMRFGGPSEWFQKNIDSRMGIVDLPYSHLDTASLPQGELLAPPEFHYFQDSVPLLPDVLPGYWETGRPETTYPTLLDRPTPARIGTPVPVKPELPNREIKTLEDLFDYAGLKVTEVKVLPEETETVRITVDDLIAAARLREPEPVYVRR